MSRRIGHQDAQRGFTLIEMVITLVLLAVLAGLGATILGGGFGAYIAGQELMEVAPRGQLAMERMTRELRGACDGTISGTGTPTLSFETAPCDGSQTRTFAYDSAGKSLTLNGAPLAQQVTNVTFGAISGGCEITLDLTVENGTVTLPLQTTVYIRNQPCTP